MHSLLRLSLAVFSLMLVACEPEKALVDLNVQAQTNQGDPVAEAMIFVDDQFVGKTDNLGRFNSGVEFQIGTNRRLQVRKDSDLYYFAPYFQNFEIDQSKKQKVDIAAVLYFVPKPQTEPDPTIPPGGSTVAAKPVEATEPVPVEASVENAAEDLVANTEPEVVAEDILEEQFPAVPAASEHQPSEDQLSDTREALVDEAMVSIDEPIDTVAVETDVLDEPEPAPVILTPVDETSPDATKKLAAAYPKPERSPKGQIVFTIHVYTGEKPIAGAEVLMGEQDSGDLRVACNTNDRGRCVVRFNSVPIAPVTFVAKRRGYQTKTASTRVGAKGQLRFSLLPGKTLDVFAITKNFNYTRGLEGVEVFVEGQLVGKTDAYGHMTYVYTGKDNDLIQIAMRPDGYIPENFETDFVVGGPMTLVRYFSPASPPPVKMTLLKVQPAGKISEKNQELFEGQLDRKLRTLTLKHVFASGAFQEFPVSAFERALQTSDLALTEVLKRGWQNEDMKGHVDALLVPTLVLGDKPILEMSIVDSQGKIVAAAKELLSKWNDEAAIDKAMTALAHKMVRAFPFQGAILDKNGDTVDVNLGFGTGRGLQVGDKLQIYGIQLDKRGQSQVHRRIAEAQVAGVEDQVARAKITNIAPRAAIERGDVVMLNVREAPTLKTFTVEVKGHSLGVDKDKLAQANVYFNDRWVGATDENGRLYIDADGAVGELRVIKHGFRGFDQKVKLASGQSTEISLRRETAFLRIDSKPSAATVKVDGKVIGKTPVSAPVPVPSGFVKLEVEGPTGFKTFSQVLELDHGTLDLTGAQAVNLERDLRASARRLLDAGKVEEAIAKYKEIAADHSDFLLARHELGEVFLTVLNQPAQAAKAFSEVTTSPEVAQFNDKRFIGSHINRAIALFLAAEQQVKEAPAEAQKTYAASIEAFEAVVPQLRFVPKEQYAQAVHNVEFHRALIRHRLWRQTKDPLLLNDTVKAWQAYLNGSATSVPIDGEQRNYVENAKVYLKQATAQLAQTGKGAEQSRQ